MIRYSTLENVSNEILFEAFMLSFQGFRITNETTYESFSEMLAERNYDATISIGTLSVFAISSCLYIPVLYKPIIFSYTSIAFLTSIIIILSIFFYTSLFYFLAHHYDFTGNKHFCGSLPVLLH